MLLYTAFGFSTFSSSTFSFSTFSFSKFSFSTFSFSKFTGGSRAGRSLKNQGSPPLTRGFATAGVGAGYGGTGGGHQLDPAY